MSRWEGFEELVQVVDSGSFSAAAKVLRVSKAHVSQQISRLEARLGSRLLHRTTRKLSLTETGEEFYRRCLQIVEDLDEAEKSVSQLQQSVTGILRVSAPHLLGEAKLVPAVAEFLKRYPELNIELSLTSRKVNLLDDGYDVAIQMGAREDVNVVKLPLTSTRFFVVASPAYLADAPPLNEPGDIKSHRKLLFVDRGITKPWRFIDPDNGDVRQINIQSHWRSNSGQVLRAAAKRGLGLAYLPDYYLKQDLDSGRLIPCLEKWTTIDRDIVAIYQHRAFVSAKIRMFTGFLMEFFGENR